MSVEIIMKDDESLICPYCKHKHNEPDEIVDEDGGIYKCDKCRKPFRCEKEVIYSTKSMTEHEQRDWR